MGMSEGDPEDTSRMYSGGSGSAEPEVVECEEEVMERFVVELANAFDAPCKATTSVNRDTTLSSRYKGR